MVVKILSTVGAWAELADMPHADQRVAAWLSWYEASFRSIFDVYYSAWGAPARRSNAAVQAPSLREQILAAEGRARHLLTRAENDFLDRGLLVDELHAVLLVGSHTSNGWVAELDGQPSLFLALEYLGTPPYDDLLVVHEIGHVVQMQLSPPARDRTYTASLAAMIEGVATATSRVLRPGHTDSAYLWMDEDHETWIDECVERAPAIALRLLRHADAPDDDKSVAPLFRNHATPTIPARCGYWVGDLIARGMLMEGRRLNDLLSIESAEARYRVLDWANRNRG